MDGQKNITDKNGYYKIIAIDHRDSLKKILQEKDIIHFKTLAAIEFSPYASAILLDRTYGTQARMMAKSKGLGIIWTAEKSGYKETDIGRVTELYDDFNPMFEKENFNVSCIKILLYYNRESKTAKDQIKVLQEVKARCEYANLPLLVEPITYAIDNNYNKAESILHAIEDIKYLTDIFKLEFPLDVTHDNSFKVFIDSKPYLEKINELCEDKPWILLSRGMPFDLFKEAVKITKNAGAKGYAVGRAVWQELENFKTWEEKASFIKTTAKDRMKELSIIYE